jgi:hypothetical protein
MLQTPTQVHRYAYGNFGNGTSILLRLTSCHKTDRAAQAATFELVIRIGHKSLILRLRGHGASSLSNQSISCDDELRAGGGASRISRILTSPASRPEMLAALSKEKTPAGESISAFQG